MVAQAPDFAYNVTLAFAKDNMVAGKHALRWIVRDVHLLAQPGVHTRTAMLSLMPFWLRPTPHTVRFIVSGTHTTGDHKGESGRACAAT